MTLMFGRRTRNVLVKLVRALHTGTECLVLRLEAGDRLTGATAGGAGVAQDPPPPQSPKRAAKGPPAHWLAVVSRHAPQLLRPLSGRRDSMAGLREHNKPNTAADPVMPSTPAVQTAPPAAGKKAAATVTHDSFSAPDHHVRRRRLLPESGRQVSNRNKVSRTPEEAQPPNPAPPERPTSVDETAVPPPQPAPREAPVVHAAPRLPRYPSGAAAPFAKTRTARPVQRNLPQQHAKVHDSVYGPAETARGLHRPEQQTVAVPAQKRQTPIPPARRPDTAQVVEKIVLPVREVTQVAAQAQSATRRSDSAASAQLPAPAPAALVTPSHLRLPGEDAAVARPMQSEPEWPSLPGEEAVKFRSAGTGAERWPALPDSIWDDPQVRLSGTETLWAASEEQRNRLRSRRRELEQRGELWSV